MHCFTVWTHLEVEHISPIALGQSYCLLEFPNMDIDTVVMRTQYLEYVPVSTPFCMRLLTQYSIALSYTIQ